MKKLKLSAPTPMQARFELVELVDAKDENGEPYVVWCGPLSPMASLRILKQLPGRRPNLGLKDDDPPPPEALEARLAVCLQVIEEATAFAGPDGGLVRPAFYFGAPPAHGLSLDGNQLTAGDVILMGTRIMVQSGFSEEAASKSFPARKRN